MTTLALALSVALSFTYPSFAPHLKPPPIIRIHRPRRIIRRPCVSIRCTMRKAIRLTHAPTSWLQPLLWLAWRESRDNPRAVAYEGTAGGYAEGLMQMLPSTFAAHALPGRMNIWNPVDNAVASIRYIQSRYGAPTNIPGIESQNYSGY